MVENCRLTSGSLSSERRSSNLGDTTNLNLARPEEKICLPLPPPGPSPYRGPGARHVLKHEVSYFNKNKGKTCPPPFPRPPFLRLVRALKGSGGVD